MKQIIFGFLFILLHTILCKSSLSLPRLSTWHRNKAIAAKIEKTAKQLSAFFAKNLFENVITDVARNINIFSNRTLFVMPNITNTDDSNSYARGNKAHLFYNKLVDEENGHALKVFTNLASSSSNKDGWKMVFKKDGITVERKAVAAGSYVSKEDAEKGCKHACVRTSSIINCTTDKLFHLFQVNELAPKYNEHIRVLKDIHHFDKPPSSHSKSNKSQWTKITYSSGPTYGPMKARDFVSIVNYRKYENGTYIILNRPAYHPDFPPTRKFVRGTVLLAGNMIEPYGVDKQQTKFTQVTQINPGGGADTPAVAFIINKLCALGPPEFVKKLEATANSIQHSPNNNNNNNNNNKAKVAIPVTATTTTTTTRKEGSKKN